MVYLFFRKITVHDTNPMLFWMFLEYLYCGQLDTNELSTEQLADMMAVADRYEVCIGRLRWCPSVFQWLHLVYISRSNLATSYFFKYFWHQNALSALNRAIQSIIHVIFNLSSIEFSQSIIMISRLRYNDLYFLYITKFNHALFYNSVTFLFDPMSLWVNYTHIHMAGKSYILIIHI